MRFVKYLKRILIVLTVCIIAMLAGLKVFAVNYTLEVNFDGKNIEMVSPTPDMTWEIKNLYPGKEEYNIVTVSNTGTRSVDVEFSTSIISGEDLADILEIKIIKLIDDDPSLDEVVYSGKYSKVGKVSFSIDVGKNQSYKLVVGLPKDTGNEAQGKECTVKIDFVSSGIEDGSVQVDTPETSPTNDEPNEQETEENTNTTDTQSAPETPGVEETTKQTGKRISTSTIKAPQTGESGWIFVVAGVLVVSFLGLLISFFVTKKP